jgi:cytochrome c oxidase cbb3-type subunit I/II
MTETIQYDNKIVRNFAWATVVFGIVGMLVGVIIACQLFAPGFLNSEISTFGRLRPLHTNAIIFAFVGNGIFMGVYYSLQRLCKCRMISDSLSKLHFWLWQAIIVSAAITLPLGITSGKEYAELEWPIDIAITVVWVIFGINMMGTIFKRREKHLYVAIWFYIATFVTVAVLHIVNSLCIPVSFTKSYSIYAGTQDALVQWWYGHNAVAFFLTTPYLGLMYYFLPKAANRPVYSYRLSIIHFWALVFVYIWAGPHHLLYTSLPDWAQSLGMVFSLMLIAPSWGGMLNGLLTLRGAWDKVKTDPCLKFMVVAITAYGMATFEGPMMSIKSVNSLSHYTDWTVAHTHVAGLGWNGFMTFALLYWIIPKIYKTPLASLRLANFHFWLGMIGIVFWVVPMYISGVTQGLMWKEFTPEGFLAYPDFLETVKQIIPMYVLRAFGGVLYLSGALVMVVNLVATARNSSGVEDDTAVVQSGVNEGKERLAVGFMYKHRILEGKAFLFTILTTVAILIGGLVEILPMYLISSNVPTITSVKPYTPLELIGRKIYIREGCSTCHSQMIRPFRSEVVRYGEYSKAGEFVYDHPFLWGSKRIGPDLHRIGSRNPSDLWHFMHLKDPTSTSPGSIMPAYESLLHNEVDYDEIQATVEVMKRLGVPYTKETIKNAKQLYTAQADEIVKSLTSQSVDTSYDKEIIALIAYLKRLGTDISVANAVSDTEGGK